MRVPARIKRLHATGLLALSLCFCLYLCLLAPFAQAGVVTGIIDSTTLQIDLTQRVRIANILAPPATARQLRAVLLNQPVTLTDSLTDITGVTSASVQTVNGDDIAAQLVGNGLARVWPLQGRDDLALVRLLTLEDTARKRQLGLWHDTEHDTGHDPAFAVATPETASRLLNSYGIVEGIVTGVASIKGRYYINFGADWKTDFTVQLTKAAMNRLLLPPYKLNWTQLTGKRIRVRGWIETRNGPMLTITMPAQLELVQ